MRRTSEIVAIVFVVSDRCVEETAIMVLSRLARAVTGVDPTWADPVYSHPSGSLKGPVAVPFYRGSFLDRDPFIHLMIYSAGVEVDVLPSRIPPQTYMVFWWGFVIFVLRR